MEKEVLPHENLIVEPRHILNAALELCDATEPEQVVVFMKKDEKYEVFSSHKAEDMEELVDNALDKLYDGEIGFDEE